MGFISSGFSKFKGNISTTQYITRSYIQQSQPTSTVARNILDDIKYREYSLNSIVGMETNQSNNDIGLIIGLPVGFCCLCVLLLLLYFYWKRYNREIQQNVSPSSRNANWFTKLIYKDENNIIYSSKNRDESINKKNLPFGSNISSHIQYKLSKPLSRVFTPKEAAQSSIHKDNKTKFMEEDYIYEAEKYLYSKPQDLYNIFSDFPTIDKEMKVPSSHNISHDTSAWKYESPLSKLLVRSSLYLKDFGSNLKSLDAQVRRQKVPSHVVKNYVDVEKMMDERSPILASQSDSYYIEDNSHITSENEKKESDVANSGIGQQILYPTNSVTSVFNIDPVPVTKKNIIKNNETSKKNTRKYRKHLKYITQLKPLPLTPSSKYTVGKVFFVATDYNAKLTDEIDLTVGEHVRVLAVHSDGWCLVEKCNATGTSLSHLIKNSNRVGSKQYLNDDRGIVPGYCLKN